MVALPPEPLRIARLRKDERGFPVPWFVAWLDGDGRERPPGSPDARPDFRVISAGKLWTAYSHSRCWVCGVGLGVHRVNVIGPMCVVNRVTSEPPSHRDCAEFAAKACPFLTRPRMRRNEKDLPQGGSIAGIHIDRNPGAVALYETRDYRPFRSGSGYLFRLGEPTRIDWWAEGRPATRAQIEASIESGFPLLMDAAVKYDGPEGVKELIAMKERAMALLPAA